MHKRPLPLLPFLFALFTALAVSFPGTGLAGFCETEKDPFPDPSGESVSDGSECPPGSSSLAAADNEEGKETSQEPVRDPFPSPPAVDTGTPPPVSAGAALAGSSGVARGAATPGGRKWGGRAGAGWMAGGGRPAPGCGRDNK